MGTEPSQAEPPSSASRGRWCVLAAAVLWSTSGFFAQAPIFADWPLADRGMLLACDVCQPGAGSYGPPAQLVLEDAADAGAGGGGCRVAVVLSFSLQCQLTGATVLSQRP